MIDFATLTLISDMLVRATPLILAGLAVAFAFQAGVLNIGAEGQLLIGAASATSVALALTPLLGRLVLPIALIVGAIAGGLWALIAAELRRRFRVLEVISTIMLNFVAIFLVGFLVRGPLQEPTHIYPQTVELNPEARLPILIPGTRLHAGFAIAVICCIAGWWILRRTAAGFRLRIIGANPSAGRVAGRIDVEKTARNIFLVSGALAGLAGAIEVHGVTFALYENLSPGYGYTAIAVALLADLNPLLVLVTGVFFGALETLASALQRDVGIPATLVSVIEALVVLIVLAIQRLRSGRTTVIRKAAAYAAVSET
ncbi:MAG TPA: ABC transporter permease [Gemmatimonadaceae bacterium]|nr:ABC transporter permease [Gemmatimonadaceae bacterium]